MPPKQKSSLRSAAAAAGAGPESNSNRSNNSNGSYTAPMNGTVNTLGLSAGFGSLFLGFDPRPLTASDMEIIDDPVPAKSYDMEVEAFGSREGQLRALYEKTHIKCFELNTEKPEYVKYNLEDLLQKVDYIHCKAFGNPTGITVESPTRLTSGVPPSINNEGIISKSCLCILFEGPDPSPDTEYARIAAAATSKSSFPWGAPPSAFAPSSAAAQTIKSNSIILICIINYHEGNKVVDIWSVAKNTYSNFPNAFQKFLNIFKEENDTIETFYLTVGTDDTVTMTEQGRIRLYSSLGFALLGGGFQQVQLIYPPGQVFNVYQHLVDHTGQIILSRGTGAGIQRYCNYIGNIQSVPNAHGVKQPIVMIGKKKDVGTFQNIYLGYSDKLSGKSAYIYETPAKIIISEVRNKLRDNESIPIHSVNEEDLPNMQFIKGLYHMGLKQKESITKPGNKFVETLIVPSDFLIFTVTSPGSYLFITADEIDNFIQHVLSQFMTHGEFEKFKKNNKSTQKLPIINIPDEDDYTTLFTTPTTDDDHALTQTQFGFYGAKIMEQLGRQPIFEFLRRMPPGGATVLPQVKKYQLDFQLYGPGMKMFDYEMMRDPSAGSQNVGNRMGTYSIQPLAGFTQNRNDEATLLAGPQLFRLHNYLEFLRSEYPVHDASSSSLSSAAAGASAVAATKPRFFLFLFGCSGLPVPDNSFDLLYELSHRRMKKEMPVGLSYDNPDFINKAIFNKYSIDDNDCGPQPTNFLVHFTGGKRRRKQTRKQTKRKTQRRKTRKQ